MIPIKNLALAAAVAALCAVCLPSARADGPPETAPPAPALTEAQQRLQLRIWELIDLSSDGMPRKQVVDKLAAAASTDLRPLFDVYAGVADREQEDPPSLTAAELDSLLFDALLRVDFDRLAAHLADLLEQGAGLEQQLRAVELLAESPHPRSQELVAEVLAGFKPIWLESMQVSARVTAALRRGLAQHASAARVFAKDPEALAPQLLPLIARAAPAGGDGTRLLQGLLGIEPALDEVVLECLALQAKTPIGFGSKLLHREVTEQVRSRLGSDDAGVRARALVVMGYLTDAVSFERQILLLKDRDARVQARALWALKQATGRSFGAEVEAWAEWFEREQVWLRKVGIPAQRKLTACSDAEALTLIRELMGHPIFRHELSATLVPVLFRENPAVVEAACVALEQLRSSCAVGYLVEGLEHAEPTCREVIHATLLRVTGLELPLDQSAWLARFSDLR